VDDRVATIMRHCHYVIVSVTSCHNLRISLPKIVIPANFQMVMGISS